MKENIILGGLAATASPNKFDPKQLAMGMEVEKEHTDDPEVAKEIAAGDSQYNEAEMKFGKPKE